MLVLIATPTLNCFTLIEGQSFSLLSSHHRPQHCPVHHPLHEAPTNSLKNVWCYIWYEGGPPQSPFLFCDTILLPFPLLPWEPIYPPGPSTAIHNVPDIARSSCYGRIEPWPQSEPTAITPVPVPSCLGPDTLHLTLMISDTLQSQGLPW